MPIYLDVDGHVTSGTSWNSSYAGGASIVTPANTGHALDLLRLFWAEGRPLPLRSFTKPEPYRLASA